MLWYTNYDLIDIVTPVKGDCLRELLTQESYDAEKIDYLYTGFTQGFSLGYDSNPWVQKTSDNLKLRIGNLTEMWNRVMKEVKDKRYAGPYTSPLLNISFSLLSA